MRLLLLTCPHLLMHQRSAAMSAEGNPALVFWGVGLLAELRATWLTDRHPSQAQLR